MKIKSQLLLDSDVLIGFFYVQDPHHQAAGQLIQSLKREKTRFVITQYTISEVATVLSHKVNQKLAQKFLETAAHLPTIYIPEEVFNQGLQLFAKQQKKGNSVVDCINVVALKKYRLTAICSFDKAYEKQYGVAVYTHN